VTVVVDFGTLGGGMQTRCAPEPVSSGFDALTKAGFTYEGTVRFPGLLCRIDGKPSSQQEACNNAPSPKYYWAYWTASSPGGAWTYSDMGAGNRDPAPGSAEGWAFSDGCSRKPGAPTTCPGATTTTTVAASSTTTRAPASGGPAVTATSVAGRSTTTAAGMGQTTVVASEESGTDSGDARMALPSSGASRNPGGDDLALAQGDTKSASSPSDGGSPAGVLAGAGVALLLGLGAAARLRLRRRSSPSAAGPE
jgi:hypothetical protein